MINIAIIEDSREDYEFLAEGIKEYSEKSGEAVSVRRYESALRFLDEYKFNYDIIFMDIELPDINGVLASEKLRARDNDVALVFVTNLAHLAIKGYAVSAADFIVKPVNYYKLSALLAKLIKNIKLKRDDYITISTAGGMERISLSAIVYVEAEAHRITFHLKDRKVTYSGTLTACEKLLPEADFVRCYQSFIVNVRYIESCDAADPPHPDRTTTPVTRLSKNPDTQTAPPTSTRGGGINDIFVRTVGICSLLSGMFSADVADAAQL